MVLLGINCGFGNHDVGSLTVGSLDLKAGWVDHPRPKTRAERRCPLWPETIEALQKVLRRRPEPDRREHAKLVFLTRRRGQPYVGINDSGIW